MNLRFINKNKDIILVFILSTLLSVPVFVGICSGYLNYAGFDQQGFLLWNYTAVKGYIPYKDFFYPYGLIAYLRNSNFIFLLLNFFLAPLLFTLTFLIFKKAFKNIYFVFFSIFVFYYFIVRIVGIETFSRYGILVVSSLILADFIYKKNVEKLKLFGSGIFLGLMSLFFPDLGIYVATTFLLLYFVRQLFAGRVKISRVLNELKFLVFGLIAVITPLIIFLFYTNSLDLFMGYYREVRNIALVAKTPFFSFIDSPSNIFTLSILFASIFFLFYRFLYFKNKISLSSFFQIALIINILILEQKSIVRSIDLTITFVSLILLMLFAHEFICFLRIDSDKKKIFYYLLILSVVVLFGFNVPHRDLDIRNIVKSVNLAISNRCFDSNLQTFLSQKPSYAKIIDLLKKREDFNSKVFSFPMGNSSFYILLNQKPPFYNSTVEGASYSNQNLTIDYIKKNRVEYIILNTDTSFLIDGVPDFIRQPILFRYILNNYKPLFAEGDHIILKKEPGHDFFSSDVLKRQGKYRDHLLKVNLYKIPYSEGFYKYDYLVENSKLLLGDSNIDKINIVLGEGRFNSEKKVVVVIPSIDHEPNYLDSMNFQTADGNSTTIFYNSCKKNEPCIINLSRLPLFYQNRVVAKISVDEKFEGYIKIFELSKPGDLW